MDADYVEAARGRASFFQHALEDRSPVVGCRGAWLDELVNDKPPLGEQVYGFVSSDYRADRLFGANPRERVLGGGAIVPLSGGTVSLNPEATFSHTSPKSVTGAPAAIGKLRRLTVRLNAPILQSRRESGGVTLTVEQIEERSEFAEFDAPLSYDRYMAARLGGSFGLTSANGRYLGMRIQFSHGLGNLGAASEAEVLESGSRSSRQGAGLDFSKLTIGAKFTGQLPERLGVSLNIRGQTSFGSSIFRSEQFTLEGEDGLSGYVGGHTAVDTGFSARTEIARPIMVARCTGPGPASKA